MKVKYIGLLVSLILAGCSSDTPSAPDPAPILPTTSEGCELTNNNLVCVGSVISIEGINKIKGLNSIRFEKASITQNLMNDLPVLENIKHFSYKGNLLDNEQFDTFSFSKFPNNEVLEITGNHALEVIDLESGAKLKSLTLNDTSLLYFNLNALTELRSLNLRNNKIDNVDLTSLTKLQSLDLSINKISDIRLSDLTQLNSINLSNNLFRSINLIGLTQLESLDLSINLLESIDLIPLTELKSVNLMRNYLLGLNLGSLKKLESLNLSYNPLEGAVFEELTNLKSLNLENSRFKAFETNGLLLLESLRLANNAIKYIDISQLTPSLTEFTIRGNVDLEKDKLILNPDMSFSLSLFNTRITKDDLPALNTKYPNITFTVSE